MGAFQVTDPTTQTILGSYASNLGKNDNDLSGKAVIESASVGNAAAEPYVVGYLAGLAQMATIHVDLMPKYLLSKRTIPVVNVAGDKSYQQINTKDAPKLDYDEKAIKVQIEAGVNFQVQKSAAVDQIIALTRANETLGQFFSDEDGGLNILVKNLNIYGADALPEAVERWSQKRAKQQEQAQQMQEKMMMNDPRMIKAQVDQMKVQLEGQQMQLDNQQREFDNQIQIAKLANEKILVDSKVMEAEAKVSQAQIDSAVQLEKAQTSLETHALDSATKIAEIQSREHDKQMDYHHLNLEHRKLDEAKNKEKD